jgi:hypothetical protein
VAVLIFFIIKIFLPNNDVETETLFCGPNNSKPVKVYKNPSKAFPVFALDYTTKLSSGINIIDSVQGSPEIKANISLDLNSKIVELREKLNQESARMEIIAKSNFLAFNANPCDSVIARKYYELLATIVEKNNNLEMLIVQLTLPKSKGGASTPNFALITDTSKIRSAFERFSENYKFEK